MRLEYLIVCENLKNSSIIMKSEFKTIGFDADDTLWVNEPYFRDAEKEFCKLLADFGDEETISKELYRIEMQNLSIYGYGVKGFTLSLIETALAICKTNLPQEIINQIINLGKEIHNKPVELLDGVRDVLDYLHNKYVKLIVATKGDLLHQERKLKKSKLEQCFHHVEIMSDKKESDYLKLLSHLKIEPQDFLMIGNSLKSDIIPVLNIGGSGIHIPFHITWEHEKTSKLEAQDNYREVESISDILNILKA